MKSHLKFYDADNHKESSCGEVLDIEFGSQELDWSGIIIEKGSSPHFYPQNVYTPYFYFALALEQDLNWDVTKDGDITSLKTSPGNIWINPPRSPFTHDISEPCYFAILAIEEKVFLESCPLKIDIKNLKFLNNYNVVDEVIKNIMEMFLMEAQASGRNGSVYLNNLVSLLSTHYIQNYSNYYDLQKSKSSSSKFDQSQVDKIDTYINQNIGNTITVEELADLLNCSKFYFLREFKKFTEITPYQYLINMRLEKAVEQLKQQDPNIAVIADQLGFNDQSHFTRAFKSHYSMTPGQYIKNKL